ncbi:hypothetical protein FGO68_gene2155 [Halteria grandinella]|uniref:Uncharacterized protein n=1 Tax=Halteria grandinella TaxID=5974 RepID=A0A8J8NRX9_HALGN|nr:hypothetical protein FGO68_gene2155 [Halteria grandinella]
MLVMLASLKKLVNLNLHQPDLEEPFCDKILQQITQYAIDNMEGLRTLEFRLQDPPLLKEIMYKHRLIPLIVTFIVDYQAYLIIDMRNGMRWPSQASE